MSEPRYRGERGGEVEVVINDYISRELVQDPALLPLGNATSLLETGVLDSLSLLRLVVFIQERFGIVVDDVDLVPENFDTRGCHLRLPPLLGRGDRGPGRRSWVKRASCCAARRSLPTGWR